MRQSTHAFDLGHRSAIDPRVVDDVLRQGLAPTLRAVDVYIFGVDGNGVSVQYWQNLRAFWVAYFDHIGAVVKEYSMLRWAAALGE